MYTLQYRKQRLNTRKTRTISANISSMSLVLTFKTNLTYNDIFDMDAVTAGKLFSLATEVARALKNELHCDGLNIVQNNGEAAGQTVMHFHLHLIPRMAGDDVKVTWSPKDSNQEELQELAKALRKRI